MMCRLSSVSNCTSRRSLKRRALPIFCVFASAISCLLLAAIASPNCTAQEVRSEQTCPRPEAGAAITNPPELRSHNGVLELSLHLRYQRTLVSQGPPRYCYVTDDGLESPTLRVFPGDELIIHLHNDLPPVASGAAAMRGMHEGAADEDCTAGEMNASVTNLHFHGMTMPPVCHQDDVLHTTVPAGTSFDYRVAIPADEPPGLYWYHPHPHGYSERQIQGGASGAIIVEGLGKSFPEVVSLPERIIVLRDQQRIGPEAPAEQVPTWDVSANFVPIVYPQSVPAVIHATAGDRELWRVVNAGADTILDLELSINGVAQPFRIMALDAVPIRTDGEPGARTQNRILLPPGARAEFIVTAPPAGQTAQFITQAWNTGPEGDNDTQRTIANVVSSGELKQKPLASSLMPEVSAAISAAKHPPVSALPQRQLYFSQRSSNPQDPDNFVLYFITVEGQTPAPYKMGSPPNIVVHQGDVEDWTIENRSREDHVFHIHQIHFKVLEVNRQPVVEPGMRDTIDIPFWSGSGPYPSVKLRMDFSDPNTVGTFLYHCHILKHEDMGMMGAIQVLPPVAQVDGRSALPLQLRDSHHDAKQKSGRQTEQHHAI